MNTGMNTTEEQEHDVTAIVEKGFPVAISSLGVILNLLSISGILGRKPLRRWKNIFTLNLSLSDFVASLGILISYVPRLHQGIEDLPWSEPMFTTGLIMSILSTLVIAVHRFIIVRFDPLGNRQIVTPCRSITVCVIGWVTVAAVYTVAFYLEGSDPIISRIGSTVAIWVSLVLTLLCYIFIYCRIACASKLSGLTEQMLGVNKRILLTFALVIGSTFFCWIPISLILLLEGLGILEDAKWVGIFDIIAFNLLCFNQVINPLIYWTRLTEFRDQLPCCGRRRLPEDEQTITMSNVSLHDKEANRSIRS